MSWASKVGVDFVTYSDLSASGIPLKSGQSHVTSNDHLTKSEAIIKYSLNTTNPYLSPKTGNRIVAKRDLESLAECGTGTYNYYYLDNFKLSAISGKVSYTISGLSASEVINVVYNSVIIHVATANASGVATGNFFFPYDGSNQFIILDSTLY